MTQQEMHIAICKWMGLPTPHIPTEEERNLGSYYHYEYPPLTLDWLHECEMKLIENQKLEFEYLGNLPESACAAIFATKEQRLEALYKTLFPVV